MAKEIQENPLPVAFTLQVNGSPVPDTVEVTSISINKEVNRIATAEIWIIEGGAFGLENSPFENSESSVFVPGNELEVKLGYGDETSLVYSGLILKQRLMVRNNDSVLAIECADKSIKLTKGRHSGVYSKATDSDVFKKIVGLYGISNEIDDTTQQYGQLVQHNCSHWDYMLIRSEVNNMVTTTDNNTLKVKKIDFSKNPEVKISADNYVIDVDLSLDAENVYKEFKVVSWDENQQEIIESTTNVSESLPWGNIHSAELSDVLSGVSFNKSSTASLEISELEAYGESAANKSMLDKIKGRIQIPGTDKINPGEIIALSGFGDRFNGNAFVSKVMHQVENGDWISSIYLGQSSKWHSSVPEVEDHGSSGYTPAATGLFIGKVHSIHKDPDGNYRVQLSLPSFKSETSDQFVWSRIAFNYASNGAGFFFYPEIGDEVLVGFINNDPRHPVVMGGLYSQKNKPGEEPDEKNQYKSIVTRSGISLRFDDEQKVLTIETPGGNKFALDDEKKQILAEDLNGNSLTMNDSGISLDSSKDITIRAKGKISLDATGAVEISSKSDIKSQGLNIAQEAKVGFKAAGNASAELSASGQTTVKGAMVMIN